MNETVDGTINQISSSSFGWWSSFVCSLHVALFHEGFCLVVGWLAGWVNSGPPPPAPPRKKISQGWAQRRRLPLVSVGLDCRTCIERRLDRDCLDVFVGWLLIPTRRGVGG